jgi:hypothetical protein
LLVTDMFRMTVHPGVYETVGLPGWKTWRRANKTPQRLQMRYDACRGVLRAMVDAGVLKAGRIPRAWRRLCGVDRQGQPVAAS